MSMNTPLVFSLAVIAICLLVILFQYHQIRKLKHQEDRFRWALSMEITKLGAIAHLGHWYAWSDDDTKFKVHHHEQGVFSFEIDDVGKYTQVSHTASS